MARKLFCAMVVMAIGVSFVAAADYQCRILKVDGDTVTIQKLKGKGKKQENDGDPVKIKASDKVKVVSGKFDADTKKVVDGEDVKDGLKNELFTKGGDKGVGATVTTEGEGDKELITKIRVFMKKKAE
jgi:hypothetical protein